MNTLTKRIITATVLLFMAGAALFVLPPPTAIVLFSLFVAVGVWEWSAFLGTASYALRVAYSGAIVLLAIVLQLFLPGVAGGLLLVLAVAQIWWLLVIGWLLFGPLSPPRWLVGVAGMASLVPAWLALIMLLDAPSGHWRLVWLVAIVAAADTGAYFSGRAFGRHKLAPAISPGKTVEGLVGGLLLSMVAAATGAWIAGGNAVVFALAGAAVALVSVAGDLLVSVCKRRAGLKDSGWILPGHGGVLDRIDSQLSALPLFVLLWWFIAG